MESHGKWLGWPELLALVLLAVGFAVPSITRSVLVYSVLNQAYVGVVAALSVWIMLRMNLLSFATPAFMAIGGYTVAIAGQYNITDAFLMTAAAFILPALVAIPLGALVLRLRGTYFVLVTFVLSQIMQLLLFETPALTGGSNGIAGIPAVTLFGTDLGSNKQVLQFACGLAILATLITGLLTRYFRQHFAAIEENEILAESLGLVVWRYKAIGFVVAAGVSGLAGYSLVNMLLTAHPSSFDSGTAVDFIAYTIIGGRVSILGPILGTGALVYATNLFGTQGQYAQGLYGILILVVVLVARGGIVGTIQAVTRRLAPTRGSPSWPGSSGPSLTSNVPSSWPDASRPPARHPRSTGGRDASGHDEGAA
jgi:branched-chain amino acid transport system permease protein